jgi:hypothetical protein
MTTPDDTVTLTFAAHDLPSEFRPEVESVLRGLVPVVTSRVKARRRERLEQLVDVLTQDVRIRELDVRHAQMQARAVKAVLENSEWLSAEQIGELGGFSKSNLAAPANRWKQEGKIFALPYQGQDRFPRYALDEVYRPLPVAALLRSATASGSAQANVQRPTASASLGRLALFPDHPSPGVRLGARNGCGESLTVNLRT